MELGDDEVLVRIAKLQVRTELGGDGVVDSRQQLD